MTTVIEDNQLNAELQELYLLSKDWISDIEFLERDLDFLKKLFGETFSPLVQKDNYELIADILINTAKIDKTQVSLKIDILNYLHNLEQLINNCDQSFYLNLLETHTKLEQKLRTLILDFKAVKKIVFDFAKEEIKKEDTYL